MIQDMIYNIQLLSIPIDCACRKYLTNDYIITHPNIINLFKYAQNGLMNLIKIYNNKIINNYIQQIIINIDKYITNNSLISSNISLMKKNKSFESNISNDSIKTLNSNKSNSILSNTNKTIIRYCVTGYFILNDIDDINDMYTDTNYDTNNDSNDDNYDDNYDDNMFNNNNINDIINNKDLKISDKIWNINNIKLIINLMENYINDIEFIEYIIESYIKKIDNIFVDYILY